ncbi:unnamed protein product [Microthlaspi erraticum]|uniref:Uncharacterized protein n=1 Tax=Microthlaspi erraticum TaxID=1685480 RepID=A0A6D2IYF3_9BRAS|nr:unnamed protein product [Microthlaspi erraticum]
MEILGPHAKGKKETWLFVAFEILSLNLSYLNSAALIPHSSVSRWTSIIGRLISTPAGSGYQSEQRECFCPPEIRNVVENFLDMLRIHYRDDWCSSKACRV